MHLMICHRCVLVFTEFLDFLKQIIILIWDFLLLYIYIYIEGSQVIICDSKNVSLSIKIYFILAIIADTNKILYKAVSLLCQRTCLDVYSLKGL